MPVVQKPHWLAPAAAKAPTQRALREGGRPSTVVTERPATRRTAVTHATRAAPSTQTVQHPHWPWGLHPSLTEWQRNCSRSASSSEVPCSSGTTTVAPLRMKVTAEAVAASLS
jgi:hypothetical protein